MASLPFNAKNPSEPSPPKDFCCREEVLVGGEVVPALEALIALEGELPDLGVGFNDFAVTGDVEPESNVVVDNVGDIFPRELVLKMLDLVVATEGIAVVAKEM